MIVPVYKVEKYINRCINSITAQIYENLEIILVDDGSPDSCGKICDDYAKSDERIFVIHKENGGLSDARNVALKVCKGSYITCIDSDDWVSEWYVYNLYNAIKRDNSDMAISGFLNVCESRIDLSHSNNILKNYKLLDSQKCFEKLLYQNGVETSAWGKLYKRELLDGLEYPVGKLYEDIPVTTAAIHRCGKIALIMNTDYYYFQRNDSIQYVNFNHQKMDAVIHIIELQHFIKNNYPSLEKAAICRTFCTICNLVFSIDDTTKHQDDYKVLWNIIKDYRLKIIFDRKARKKAKVAAIISYAGYPFCRYVYIKTQIRGRNENITNSR